MGTQGLLWFFACAACAAVWITAASWQAEAGAWPMAVRGLLGGAAALGSAYIGYGVLQIFDVEPRWEWVAHGAWPALGFASVIGLVEEGAKFAGVALAIPPGARLHRRRSVLRTTAGVAAVFAVAETALALRGSSWPIALGRAALSPVAHAALAAPFALVLADAAGVSRAKLALRIGVAIALAAVLHGLGDWSVARAGWGRAGFAAALLVPTLWFFVSARRRTEA